MMTTICHACKRDHDSLVRCIPLDDDELAKLAALKRRKGSYASLLPAWAKPKPVPTPFRFVAGAKPVYPAHCQPNRIGAGGINQQFPPAIVDRSIAEYVQAFERINNLTHA